MTSSTKTTYLENRIRDGFTSEDVRLWQALCRQCEMEVGDSVKYMRVILDLAHHNDCGPLDLIKTGRICSEQKNVNQKFMEALMLSVYSDGEDIDADIPADDVFEEKPTKVLDLTADDDLSSASYEEEEGEGPFDDDRDDTPNSKDAYEIDGFVVEDVEASPSVFHTDTRVTTVTAKGLARSNALVKKEAVQPTPTPKKRLLKRRLDFSEDKE